MVSNVEDLLKEIYLIKEKYEFLENETKQRYNIFSVLDVMSKEVQTHSRFLADLLSPEGMHQHGSLFLEMFLKNVLRVDGFDIDNCKVQVELGVGELGRIDIVIRDTNLLLIIENKIWASDQDRQLERYAEYAGNSNQDKYHLYYLTLDGSLPSKTALGNLVEGQVNRITYRKEDSDGLGSVYNWIESCISECANHSGLREVLNQYLKTLKYLTGNKNSNMTNEIITKIKESESNLKDMLEINKVFNSVAIELVVAFCQDVKHKIETEKKITITEIEKGLCNVSYPGLPKITFGFRRPVTYDHLAWWVHVESNQVKLEDRVLSQYDNERKDGLIIIWKDYSYNQKELLIKMKNGSLAEEVGQDISKILSDVESILK